MVRFQKRLLWTSLAAWASLAAPAAPQDAPDGTSAAGPGGAASRIAAPGIVAPEAPASRAERLDTLFAELADPDLADAARVEADIQRLWEQSGSPAMDLLLRRAQEAIEAEDLTAALDHLDAAIDHDPDFAAAWNLRGAVFFQMDEYALAMNDIAHALALEPRHYDAMEGLAIIFQETDHPELALRVVKIARAVNPRRESLREAEGRLERELGDSAL